MLEEVAILSNNVFETLQVLVPSDPYAIQISGCVAVVWVYNDNSISCRDIYAAVI